MTELELHRLLVWGVLGVAAVTFWYLFRRTAPYGRHYAGSGWGPDIPSKVGWVVMEWPAVLFFLSVYLQGEAAAKVVPLVLLTMWQIHYVHRTFIYPFRTRTSADTPLFVVAMGLVFNLVNAYINARLVSELAEYGTSWLSDPRFMIGATVFVFGMVLNLHSDNVLLRLRKDGTTKYGVPYGGAFRYVSCPNYLGEILEWTGLGDRHLVARRTLLRRVYLRQSRAPGGEPTTGGTGRTSRTTRRNAARSFPGCGESCERTRGGFVLPLLVAAGRPVPPHPP